MVPKQSGAGLEESSVFRATIVSLKPDDRVVAGVSVDAAADEVMWRSRRGRIRTTVVLIRVVVNG